jgi:hypothetical protein
MTPTADKHLGIVGAGELGEHKGISLANTLRFAEDHDPPK